MTPRRFLEAPRENGAGQVMTVCYLLLRATAMDRLLSALSAECDRCGRAGGQTTPALATAGFEPDLLMLAADIRIDTTISVCASKSLAILARSTVLSRLVSCRDATMILTRPFLPKGSRR